MDNKKKIYIILFVILYAFIALVSGIHGFAFFGLANTPILAGMLAIAFEIGQAAVLFSILTNPSQRKKVMPWILMTILTLVQVMGNVFNCYKHLILNATEDLRFFKEPIFIWTDLPDAEANVIISYLTGAVLPIVGLLLTAMITGFLGKEEENKVEEIEYIEEEEEEPEPEKKYIPEEPVEEVVKNEPEKEFVPTDEEMVEPYNSLSGIKEPESILKPVDEPELEIQENDKVEEESVPEVKLDTENEVLENDPVIEEKEKSHFINI